MKLSDLKEGDTVLVDGGFTCMKAGIKVVQEDTTRGFYVDKTKDKGFYVSCSAGRHYLDGQEDEAGELVGIRRHTT